MTIKWQFPFALTLISSGQVHPGEDCFRQQLKAGDSTETTALTRNKTNPDTKISRNSKLTFLQTRLYFRNEFWKSADYAWISLDMASTLSTDFLRTKPSSEKKSYFTISPYCCKSTFYAPVLYLLPHSANSISSTRARARKYVKSFFKQKSSQIRKYYSTLSTSFSRTYPSSRFAPLLSGHPVQSGTRILPHLRGNSFSKSNREFGAIARSRRGDSRNLDSRPSDSRVGVPPPRRGVRAKRVRGASAKQTPGTLAAIKSRPWRFQHVDHV